MANNVQEWSENFKAVIKIATKRALKSNAVRRNLRVTAKRIEQNALEMEVYSKGEPNSYHRRKKNNGLKDEKNMVFGNEKIIVENNRIIYSTKMFNYAPFFPAWRYRVSGQKYLSDLIVNGYGNKDVWYNKPRNFIKTAEELFTGESIRTLKYTKASKYSTQKKTKNFKETQVNAILNSLRNNIVSELKQL